MCSAVSYFSTRVGSIIGAGRLSFRVRDGSGRFPVAVAAVTLFFCGAGRRGVAGSAGVFGGGCGVVFCGVVARQECVLQYFLVLHFVPATLLGVGVL